MLESPVKPQRIGEDPDHQLGKPTAQAPPDPFLFVPITSTEAARGRGAAKRIVRAHVTRIQHAKSSTLGSFGPESWTVKPYIHRQTGTARRKPRTREVGERARAVDRERKDESVVVRSQRAVVSLPRLLSGGGGDDPFWTYPVDHQPSLSPIIAHYIQNVAVDIPDLDTPNSKGLLRRSWFPLAMTEAATMYAVLLMAASHFAVLNPSKSHLIDLLAIKARALAEINTALQHSKRATTDALIGAVVKMAAYEAVFGDSEVSVAHMQGLQKMLRMRGGLGTLGLDGLLERMCVWIDLNSAHLTGRAVFLGGEDFPTVVTLAAPDPYHFAGIS